MDKEMFFRGKRLNNGEWVCGSLIQMDSEGSQSFIFPFYKYASSLTCAQIVSMFMVAVDPTTVGQFTGLCDKNGVKIFEGDIVKTHYANAVKSDFVETVVFHNGRFCANSNISETGQWWTSLADGVPHVSFDKSVYMESCKIIGNIHDNPELVKEEE